jgi:hypothetical protein
VPAVHAEIVVPGTVQAAELFWYDTTRWPTWVDGLAHVERVQDGWPEVGGKVVWDSTPAGRGRVVERVVAHEPLAGQELEVEDETIRGLQRVSFAAGEREVRVSLSLEYKIKQRSIVTPIMDVLFVRRVFATTLRNTLARFAIELRTDRELDSETA